MTSTGTVQGKFPSHLDNLYTLLLPNILKLNNPPFYADMNFKLDSFVEALVDISTYPFVHQSNEGDEPHFYWLDLDSPIRQRAIAFSELVTEYLNQTENDTLENSDDDSKLKHMDQKSIDSLAIKALKCMIPLFNNGMTLYKI